MRRRVRNQSERCYQSPAVAAHAAAAAGTPVASHAAALHAKHDQQRHIKLPERDQRCVEQRTHGIRDDGECGRGYRWQEGEAEEAIAHAAVQASVAGSRIGRHGRLREGQGQLLVH